MTTLITPWFRNIFTDMFGCIMDFGAHPCASRELEVVDCLEAYGTIHGKQKCRILLDDFRECVLQGKQWQRLKIMRNERVRQWEAGEREGTWAEAWEKPPRMDSY